MAKLENALHNMQRHLGQKFGFWGSLNSRKAAIADGFLAASSKANFFSTCDVVSLHLRLKDTTSEIVKQSDLLQMKPDALFVNTAPGSFDLKEVHCLLRFDMDDPALLPLMSYDEEPIFDPHHPLLQMPNVVCTPHLGYVERSGYELYFSIAFENVLRFFWQ